MNAELEQWINNKACPLYFHDKENDEGYDGRAIMVSDMEKLFDGKVLVPVELLKEMRVYLSSNRLSNQLRAIIGDKP